MVIKFFLGFIFILSDKDLQRSFIAKMKIFYNQQLIIRILLLSCIILFAIFMIGDSIVKVEFSEQEKSDGFNLILDKLR